MNDTPRTDDAELGYGKVTTDFARQLERELNVANAKIKWLEKDLSDAYAEMRKQHPAITAVFDNSVWIKVKEAKL